MKRKIGFFILAILGVSAVGFYYYSRRWRNYEDFNFVGNYEFNKVGFVTDYDSGLAVGDRVEIRQKPGNRVVAAYEGEAEITGLTKTADNKFIFVTDKPFTISKPTNPGTWRKLNVI